METLSCGYQNYKVIKEQNILYVDKTSIIEHLLSQNDLVTLITRPRRFGKSLTLSTLEHFFSIDYYNLDDPTTKARKLFKDTKIYKNRELCSKYMGQYPVISISFGMINSGVFEGAEIFLKNIFIELYRRFSFIELDLERIKQNYFKLHSQEHSTKLEPISTLEPENTNNPFNSFDTTIAQLKKDFHQFLLSSTPLINFRTALLNLVHYVHLFFGKPVILLIDEYDVPLHSGLVNGYYDQILDFMKSVFSVIKGNDDLIFKIVITGCLRIAQESFFTGANNFNHYGIDQVIYSEDLGFTEQETLEILKKFNLEKYYSQVLDWYDGYLFGNTKIVCPWNVIKYSQAKKGDPASLPATYWINTSENAILKTVFNHINPSIADKLQLLLDRKSIDVQIDDHLVLGDLYNAVIKGDLFSINKKPEYTEKIFWTLLYHAGYLTCARRLSEKEITALTNDQFIKLSQTRSLKIPNFEILSTFDAQILQRFSNENSEFTLTSSKVFELFCNEPTPENVMELKIELNSLLNNFVSVRDRSSKEIKYKQEWYYHTFLNGMFSVIFSMYNLNPADYSSNRELGNGYADLAFKIPYKIKKMTAVIIEIKACSDPNNMVAKAKDALNQIKNKEYAQGLFAEDVYEQEIEFIYLYGIAFYGKRCVIQAETISKKELLE